MVLSGDPINDPDNGVGSIFNKFQTRCTEAPGVSASPGVSAYKPGELKVSVYDPMTCGYIQSMNPTMRNAETVGQCASTLTCENGGLKNCGIDYYTFKTTPTEAAVVRERSSLHYVGSYVYFSIFQNVFLITSNFSFFHFSKYSSFFKIF